MKLHFLSIALILLWSASAAYGQQTKLEGFVFDDKDRPVPSVNIIAPGGQSKDTDSKGHFFIAFPDSVVPGQATCIEVAKLNWVIYEPMLGNCTTQSSARHYQPLKVIIVPKGSPLALSPKRLGRVIAKWADERAKLHSQVDKLSSQLDEYAFLREYSEKYGFSLDQFVSAAQQWAQSKESDDKEEQALKEYFLKNYHRAAQLAHESALATLEKLKQDNRQRIEDGLKVIRRFKLEGNARYAENNFREALAAYNEIEKCFTTRILSKEDLLHEWAELKLLLGNTKEELGTRVEGSQSQVMLAESVNEYLQALSVKTRDQSPQEWATTQNNLGAVLCSQGERMEGAEGIKLLQQSVGAYRNALEVYTREQLPQDWARTQNNLGLVLTRQGERVEGKVGIKLLQQSVETYREALKVRTREQQPLLWAMTQNNLGAALQTQGDRLEGIEGATLLVQSVGAYREALKVRTYEQLPQEWAGTQNNLGNALQRQAERTGGTLRINLLQQSVDAYREALKVRTHAQLPQDWAATQTNLGNVLRLQGERLEGAERIELLEQSIEAFREALKVRTYEQLPQDWAATKNNLGIVLQRRGERQEGAEGIKLFQQSAKAYRDALKVRTYEQLPQDWAMTQLNLGIVLSLQGDRLGSEEGIKLLQQSIEAFRKALKVYSREQLPQPWAVTHNNLAKTYLLLRDWSGAAESYANVLTLYPYYEEAYSRLSAIYNQALFRFEDAFTLSQKWVASHPFDVSAQAALAERHFTSGRFAECAERVSVLLTKPEVPDSTKPALQAIEIADLLALGQPNQVPTRIEALIAKVSSQPVGFTITWNFDGTKHFIGQNEKLSPYRAWLIQLFAALGNPTRDQIIKGLNETKAAFK